MGTRLFRGRERKCKGFIKSDMEIKRVLKRGQSRLSKKTITLSNKKCEIAMR